MRLLIVDDEPLARLRLRTLLQDLHHLQDPPLLQAQVLGEAADAEQALDFLKTTAVDVVLLDIGLPGKGAHVGLRLADQLRGLRDPPAVIFVTAHGEHALKAFELNALDYLTKPVRLERLLAALQRVPLRAARRDAGASANPDVNANVTAKTNTSADVPTLVITERDRVLRLPLPELLYCRAEQKMVLIRMRDGSHLVDDSLSDLEQRLQALGGAYIRIHRNALVALHAIRALELRLMPADEDEREDSESWAVRVAPLDEWLPVSRRQIAGVKAAVTSARVKPAGEPGR
jgi:two-component system, LytTR family, response regulator AlgR